jgi:hypothetical protein
MIIRKTIEKCFDFRTFSSENLSPAHELSLIDRPSVHVHRARAQAPSIVVEANVRVVG